MTKHCGRFGCLKRFEWTGSKSQRDAERELIEHWQNECTGGKQLG